MEKKSTFRSANNTYKNPAKRDNRYSNQEANSDRKQRTAFKPADEKPVRRSTSSEGRSYSSQAGNNKDSFTRRPSTNKFGAKNQNSFIRKTYRKSENQVKEPESEQNIAKSLEKISIKPSLLLAPVPAVLISLSGSDKTSNILTVAWAGIVCSNPPVVSISVRPTRYSYKMLTETGEFVINIPTSLQVKQLDYCGVVSGSEVDKFEACSFTKVVGSKVKAPMIKECPINLECKVFDKKELGSHTMFLAEIVDVHVAASLMTETGRLALEKAKLTCYVHGHYYSVGRRLNKFGFSVEKKSTKKKRRSKFTSR